MAQLKIPNQKVKGHAPWNGQNPTIYDSFWAKIFFNQVEFGIKKRV